MTLPSTMIRPGDDTETLRELRFHLRELQRDLGALLAGVADALPKVTSDGETFARSRMVVASLVAAVEHAAEHHARRALELARISNQRGVLIQSAPLPATTETEVPPPSIVETHEELRRTWRRLSNTIAASRTSVDRIIAMSMSGSGTMAQVEVELEHLSGALDGLAHSEARRAQNLVIHLHHLGDPDTAAAEAREEDLATPLRELHHPEARALTRCPHCGAPLDSGDRTFDGSYCEGCRTRWLADAEQSQS